MSYLDDGKPRTEKTPEEKLKMNYANCTDEMNRKDAQAIAGFEDSHCTDCEDCEKIAKLTQRVEALEKMLGVGKPCECRCHQAALICDIADVASGDYCCKKKQKNP